MGDPIAASDTPSGVSVVHADPPTLHLPTLHRLFIVWEATAVLRHDVRNKLASARNAAFYLQRKVEAGAPELVAGDARISTFFGLIGSEIDTANGLVTDRLAPLPPPPAPSPVELAEVVAFAIPHVRVPDGVTVEPTDGAAQGRGGRAELSVAVLCLLENAIEAVTARGGRVQVRCRTRDDSAIVEIVDDGPGFGEEVLRAREPTFAARAGHLGVGLKVVGRIAARSGGRLELGEAAGGGGLATLVVPGWSP